MIRLHAERCTGCRTCAKVCPHGVLEVHGQRAVLAREGRCIECGACQLNCHEQAISVTKGAGCLVAIVRDEILKLEPKPGAT